MKRTLMLLLLPLLVTGCASRFAQTELVEPSSKLAADTGVVISVPEDGYYGEQHYRNSGRMTADAIKAAFSTHASVATVTSACQGTDCLGVVDTDQFTYYVEPEILHWEERATEWSGIPDQIKIRLTVYSVASGEKVASSEYSGKSRIMTFGGDHPQDLLPEPTNKYVASLYQ